MKRLLVLAVSLALVASCSQGDGKKGDYVIKIDGSKVTKEEVQSQINTLPEMAKEFFKGPEGKTQFVNNLVNTEVLYLEAKKKGLDKDKEYQRKVEDFKKLTLIQQLLGKEIEGWSKVSDQEVKDFYEKHKGELMSVEKVRLSQIVVKSEDDAKKVLERLNKGEDFAQVAKEASLDKHSAKSGGDLGYFKKGELDPQLENVAFRTKKGEVIPLRLKDGIHIIKVTDAQGTPAKFEDIKGPLTQRVVAEKQKENFDKYIENIKKNYKVEVNKQALDSLNFTPAAPAPQGGAAPQQPAQPQQKPAPAAPAPTKK